MSDPLHPAVVLVAERTLSARYRILFEGIFGTMQTTKVPAVAMRRFVAPPAPTDCRHRALLAPLGLRRVEASLLARGLSADDVAVTTPEALGRLLGPWTKLVCVSSSDPLGGGMSNTTTSSFWGGRLYTAHWMDQLMARIREAKAKFGFRVVFGGAGAWQYARRPEELARHGIDVLFEGFFEAFGPQLVTDMLGGREVPARVVETSCAADAIVPIRGAAIMGALELSRGCGKGCRFCAMATRAMQHVPEDIVLADMATNATGGEPNVVSTSEDFFRYGCTASGAPNPQRLCALLERMRRTAKGGFLQIDHANVASICQLSVTELKAIRGLLDWPGRSRYLWVNMGVESANGHLVAANGAGKIAPFRPDDWGELVRQAAAKMDEAGFFSVFSIVLGLPGETPRDVAHTLRLVGDLTRRRAVVFPVFHEPVLADYRHQAFTVASMTAEHLELFTACYENNFRQVPRLYWDNQRAGGVSWLKRAMVQALGRTEVRSWRRNFARMRRRLVESAQRPIGRDRSAAAAD